MKASAINSLKISKRVVLYLLLMSWTGCSGSVKRPDVIVLPNDREIYVYTCGQGICPEIYQKDDQDKMEFIDPVKVNGFYLISPGYLLELRDELHKSLVTEPLQAPREHP